MIARLLLACLSFAGILCGLPPSGFSQDAEPKIYLIGNSLTWDTLPGLLEGDVQWHIDCGKSLKYILEHPHEPCVKTSTHWPTVLNAKQFDFLCVQPHFGTTLEEDVRAISHWLDLQPTATLILHTGWNRHASFEADYHRTGPVDKMVHAPAYFDALQERLKQKYPQRTIRSTAAIDALDTIWHDIKEQQSPFKAFSELYRDDIHMTTQVGRYLMHNLMRLALGQPTSSQGFHLDTRYQHYLDHRLAERKEQLR